MKYTEIKELTQEELQSRIAEEKAALTKLKFSHAVSAIENPMRIRSIRRTIAKLNTELNKRVATQQNNEG
jgi:large subunit ribosomal protein L29